MSYTDRGLDGTYLHEDDWPGDCERCAALERDLAREREKSDGLYAAFMSTQAERDRERERTTALRDALEAIGCQEHHFCGASETRLPFEDNEGNDVEWPLCRRCRALAASLPAGPPEDER